MQKEEQVSFLAEKIRQADAVLIGGGSGLSSAAGYNHYHWLPYMEECLQDFNLTRLILHSFCLNKSAYKRPLFFYLHWH